MLRVYQSQASIPTQLYDHTIKPGATNERFSITSVQNYVEFYSISGSGMVYGNAQRTQIKLWSPGEPSQYNHTCSLLNTLDITTTGRV